MDAIPAQSNVRERTLVARADGDPITAGTVNYYLVALTGANAGKWFRDSDNSWQAAEAICGAMTHKADGHWTVSVDAAAWIDGVEYFEYAKESGDLHVPTSKQFRATPLAPTTAAINAECDQALADYGANTTVPDAAGTAAALHAITDAAIAALNNLSAAQVNAEADQALADYGPNTVVPDAAGTAAALHAVTDAAIAALNNLSAAQVNAECDQALTDYGANTTVPDAAGTAAALHAATDALIAGIAAGDATAANQATIIAYVDDLETRLTAARAAYLDAAISSRATPANVTAAHAVTNGLIGTLVPGAPVNLTIGGQEVTIT